MVYDFGAGQMAVVEERRERKRMSFMMNVVEGEMCLKR